MVNEKEKIKIKAPIVEALREMKLNKTYQFHIPGHTKGVGIFKDFKDLVGLKALQLDTTDEFDNLGTLNPESGPIKEAQELAAKAFGAEKTFFLLNGSTIGNIALAMGLTKKGQKIITNRNCHRSILTGLIISGAEPLWLVPERLDNWGLWGNINPNDVEKLLKENDDVSLCWITNPTYEGVVSDISEISRICKKYNVPLIVDEAHGSLWKFNQNLPASALNLGADAVVHSLHKTGGSMSQSSMLHISKNSLIDKNKVEKTLKLLHTTSPSLLLLASLDAARAHLQSEKGNSLVQNAVLNAKYLRNHIKKMNNIHILGEDSNIITDITKVFVKVDGLSGKKLEYILEKDYKIEIESASDKGVLILCNVGNIKKDIKYLINCFEKITQTKHSEKLENKKHMPMIIPEIKMSLREAFFAEKEVINKNDSIGRISGEVIAECPPGISILLPGEIITKEHMEYLTDYEKIEVIKK